MSAARRVATALAMAVVVLAMARPPAAAAHALLQSSDPAADSTLATSPPEVTLTFGETPDPRLSSIRVLDSGGTDHVSGGPVAAPGNPRALRVAVGTLARGVYTVAWRTVSAVDGHVAAGSFAFGVGVAPPTAGGPATGATGGTPSGTAAGSTTSTGGTSPGAVVSRWLLYVGLVALFGIGFFGLAVDPRMPRTVVWLAAVAWLVAALGTAGVIVVEWSDSGADPSAVLVSSVGYTAIVRVLATAAGGVIVAVLVAWPARVERWLFGLTAPAAAGGMLVDVAAGHAAAGESPAFDVLAQWLHVVAVGGWVGGLATLLLAIRGATSEAKASAVRVFSWWAGIGIAVVAVTGGVRAISEVGTLDNLLGTDFGRLLVVKSALLAVLAALGATNRWTSVPGALRSLVRLRRVGSMEVALGLVVLLAAGLLVNLAPPSSAAEVAQATGAPTPAPSVVVSGSDFGTSVRLRLEVSPGAAGFDRFAATLTDYDSGAPVAASSVTLRFGLASGPDVGSSTLTLAPDPGGVGRFAGTGGNLSIDGIWRITAEAVTAEEAIEIPFVLATSVASQAVDANAAAGAPTIDTVHLGGGTSVQLYFDPGRGGRNELHATFFDSKGTELPVAAATFLVVPATGAPTVQSGRQLEPGHFVIDIDVPAGPAVVDVVGPAPGGGLLHAHLTMSIQP